MKKDKIQKGDKLVQIKQIAYTRVGKAVWQRKNHNGFRGSSGNAYHSFLEPQPDRIFTVDFDMDGNIVLRSTDNFLRGVNEVQISDLKAFDFAERTTVILEDLVVQYAKTANILGKLVKQLAPSH
jgi:hypothetical protein